MTSCIKHIMSRSLCGGLVAVLSSVAMASASAPVRIPEPLTFDLVRALGAPKGELEVNVLAENNVSQDKLKWAPEVEYVLADGFAVEFELPAKNGDITDYKFAVQGTLGYDVDAGMIHGWQAIAIRNRDTGRYSADLLYLRGNRLGGPWSMLNMAGVRRTTFGPVGELNGIMNNSVFYDASSRITLGVELDSEFTEKGRWSYRVLPQAHFQLSSQTMLQVGLGKSRLNDQRSNDSIVSMRYIFTF